MNANPYVPPTSAGSHVARHRHLAFGAAFWISLILAVYAFAVTINTVYLVVKAFPDTLSSLTMAYNLAMIVSDLAVLIGFTYSAVFWSQRRSRAGLLLFLVSFSVAVCQQYALSFLR